MLGFVVGVIDLYSQSVKALLLSCRTWGQFEGQWGSRGW